MIEENKNNIEFSEDVESQKLENVWTVGKKFMYAIIGGLAFIVINGIFSMYFSSKIVRNSDEIIDHYYELKELGLEMSNNINKHKAALALYASTKESGIKTEVIDIRSRLLEINSALKLEAKNEDEEKRIISVSEKLSSCLNTGQNFIENVDKLGSNEVEATKPVEEAVMDEIIDPVKPKPKKVTKSKKVEEKPKASNDDLEGLDDLLAGLDDLDGLSSLETVEEKPKPKEETKELDLETVSSFDDLASLVEDLSVNEGNSSNEVVDLGFNMESLDFGGAENASSSSSVTSTMREYNLSVLELNNIINDEILSPSTSKSKLIKEEIKDDFFLFKILQVGLRLLLICYFITLFYFFNKGITQPIKNLRRYLMSMGRGELPDFKMKIWRDDIGEMVRALKELLVGLKATASFAKELGGGNLEAQYSLLSKNDILGNALMDMRDNLRRVADDDEKRNWVNQGVATFAEILRTNNDNIEALTDQIILFLVNYLKVNQGSIFLINDLNKKDIHLELSAIYAWDRKKFLEQRIEKGQGLVGQCWYEQKTIFMTDVPENFVRITSGLGEATPKCILIVPLISNEEIYGILEFASFKVLEKYEIDYVEKVAESIGAAIGNVRITEKTKILLEEAQQQGEELRANEEEMRQNMEEMNATQEEMDRILQEKDQVIERLTSELNALKQ